MWSQDYTLDRRKNDDSGWKTISGGGFSDRMLDAYDFEVVGMTVFVPLLTPEICQERADACRKNGYDPTSLRNGDPIADDMFDAAVMAAVGNLTGERS